MLSSLAEGRSVFENFLFSDDCMSTVGAFRSMGVKINEENGRLVVEGLGLKGLKAPKGELFLGNSGTTMRLLLGILAGQSFKAVLTGDESLSKRPMKRVTGPLREMGARISGRDDGNYAPLTIEGGALSGIDYVNELGSAQVKSAILLAGLFAKGKTRVVEPLPSRDHTERLFAYLGLPCRHEGGAVTVEAAKKINSFSLTVPGDPSAAAFFIAAAGLIEGSDLVVKNVGLNPTRMGFMDAFRAMGGQFEIQIRDERLEPVGDIHVRGGRLRGIKITRGEIPRLIDELPILMVLASYAEGDTEISGAAELRVKETDRIKSLCTNLRAVGADVEEKQDGCKIRGKRELKGGTVESFGDHRTAMSLMIAALRSKDGITVKDIDCVSISYPKFLDDLRGLGLLA